MMSVSDQTQKSLEEIGLAGYEIKAFTTLIKTGELTASNLKPTVWCCIFKDLRCFG